MLPGQQSNPTYAAMIESVDDGIGKIVHELEKLKLTEKTILIFTSDNGGVATVDWPFTPPTVNGPLCKGKGHLYEGGIRVPLIVRWPEKVKARAVCETPVITMDFLPTILEMCGVDRSALGQQTFVSKKPAKTLEKTTSDAEPIAAAVKAKETVLDGVSLLPLLTQSGTFAATHFTGTIRIIPPSMAGQAEPFELETSNSSSFSKMIGANCTT